ncbi:hypothetical protein SAMD00023353_8100270 [Rosellinia necatrix]|uniref:Uncharacterized protein n=1 Tax=Rosellinia necatrix TaxID=77044 RepID=A0A1S8AAW7_ROSNE|nr:hypothetical protein SAMD00023353_8100270 [Rosellinia necatrix]
MCEYTQYTCPGCGLIMNTSVERCPDRPVGRRVHGGRVQNTQMVRLPTGCRRCAAVARTLAAGVVSPKPLDSPPTRSLAKPGAIVRESFTVADSAKCNSTPVAIPPI